MKKTSILVLAAAALLGCSRTPESYLNKANRLHSRGKDGPAMDNYNKALQMKGDYPAALVARGLLFERLGDRQKAGQDYRKAIELDPRYLPAYNNLGGLLMDVGNYREAASLFTQALEVKNDYLYGLLNRGLAHYKLGDCAAASKDLTAVLAKNPKSELAYYHRALCWRKAKNYSAALADLDALLAIAPGAVLPRFERAKALYYLDSYGPAALEFFKLVERDQKDAASLYWLGLALFKAGNNEAALLSAEKALELRPNSTHIYALMGDVYASDGNKYRAATSYEMAARFSQKNSAYYRAKAKAMKATPRPAAPKIGE